MKTCTDMQISETNLFQAGKCSLTQYKLSRDVLKLWENVK